MIASHRPNAFAATQRLMRAGGASAVIASAELAARLAADTEPAPADLAADALATVQRIGAWHPDTIRLCSDMEAAMLRHHRLVVLDRNEDAIDEARAEVLSLIYEVNLTVCSPECMSDVEDVGDACARASIVLGRVVGS